jgi:hypothetical protein
VASVRTDVKRVDAVMKANTSEVLVNSRSSHTLYVMGVLNEQI